MRHNLSNINTETKTGDCSVCGPNVRLKPRRGSQAGKFGCYLKYMEFKHGAGRFADGTSWTAQEHLSLQAEQQGRCAICDEEKPLVVDHCHSEKKVRGLLCRECNVGLGHFRDSAEILRSAIAYLGR